MVTSSQLIDAAVSEMPRDETKKDDRRRDNIVRALQALVSANRLSVAGGTVNVL